MAQATTVSMPDVDKGFDDPIPQGEFDELFIPLKRVQNLFLIEARVDSLVGNFILDTGAPHLVLNKTYFLGQNGRGQCRIIRNHRRWQYGIKHNNRFPCFTGNVLHQC
ncbi:MAG: hypothetical protein IPI65_06360 [Bacteroidetes bacterium]|nr:hypothetical protein [Bacteroidota bacterium]